MQLVHIVLVLFQFDQSKEEYVITVLLGSQKFKYSKVFLLLGLFFSEFNQARYLQRANVMEIPELLMSYYVH